MDYGILSVPLGRDAVYGTLSVDTTKFADHIDRFLYEYGIRQVLNDAMSDKKDKDGNTLSVQAIVAKAEKKLDALYAGELRKSAEPADPFGAECYRIAMADIAANLKPKATNIPKGTKDRLLFVVNREAAKAGKPEMDREGLFDWYMSKNRASVEKRAKANMAERDKAGDAIANLFAD